MCAYTYTYWLQPELSWTTASFQKGFYILKIRNLTSVQLELILQLREYASDSHILPEKKSSLKSNITGYIK